MTRIFLSVSFFFTASLLGQSSAYFGDIGLKDIERKLRQAVSFFDRSEFVAADETLRNFRENVYTPQLSEKYDYYLAMCAYELRRVDAEAVMEHFLVKYRESYYCENIKMALARWNFLHKDYKECVSWYKSLELSHITLESPSDLQEYYFKYGYALVQIGDYKSAKGIFYRALENYKDSDDSYYENEVKFYYGDLLFKEQNYHSAIPYFKELTSLPRYRESAMYYLSQIHFRIEDYQAAATQAKELLNKNPYYKQATELEGIIGISNFNMGHYEAAVSFLEKFMNKTLNPTPENFYQLGYAYYKSRNYQKAIVQLNKMVAQKNALGQNAYFHLGNSYLMKDKKYAAVNAFEAAAKMDFDPKIKRDAWYYYAKLSYEVGNLYKSVPNILIQYIELYPDTKRTQEVFSLLLNAYITTRDFKIALDILERVDRQTFRLKMAYQKVSYLYGIELFNQEKYELSEKMLKQSIKGGLDPKIRSKALYWLAEIRYRSQRYDAALETLKIYQVSSTSDKQDQDLKLYYYLGYCYFKMEKYDNAISSFSEFIQKNTQHQRMVRDAHMRIADAYMAKQDFETAFVHYEKAKNISIESLDQDYLTYQYATCLGLLGQAEKQQEAFKTFIRKYKDSPYMEEAMFGIANSYFWQGDYTRARGYYKSVISDYQGGKYVISAEIKLGLMLYNQNKYQEAIQKFKRIVKTYPQSPEAKEAVANVKKICIDINQIDQYVEWVQTVSFMDVSKSGLDSVTYMVAEKLFFQNESQKAEKNFHSYLKKYPHGIFKNHANFYLGEIFYAQEHYTQALSYYKEVDQAQQNEFSERTLVVLSKIYTLREDVRALIPILKKLEQIASFKQNIKQARVGLMKSYSLLKDYKNALKYAQKVKQEDERFFVNQQAKLIIARSALRLGDTLQSKEEYAGIEVSGRGEAVVEALYYKSYFLSQAGKYESSNAIISEIGASYAGYKEWGGKSLVVMARNYWKLKDPYQANYILQRIIENFTAYPEVIRQAKVLFTTLEREKRKREKGAAQAKKDPVQKLFRADSTLITPVDSIKKTEKRLSDTLAAPTKSGEQNEF